MLGMMLPSAMAAQSLQTCNVRVHVVDNATGKGLPNVAVNLRLGVENRRTVQQKTDASGVACFEVANLVLQWTSVDAFSIRYLSTQADPLLRQLPEDVTITMRHLSWVESIKYVLEGP